MFALSLVLAFVWASMTQRKKRTALAMVSVLRTAQMIQLTLKLKNGLPMSNTILAT